MPAEFQQALDRKFLDFKAEDLPFAVALARLQAQAGLPMEIHWDRFAGIKPDSPITAHFYNLKAKRLLQHCLDAVSSPQERLYWWVAEDAGAARVIVSSQVEYLQANLATFEYEVADILAPMSERAGGGDDLIDLVKEAIAPDSWVGNTNGFATIAVSDTRLAVRQTKENHRLVQHLLSEMRDSLGPKRRTDIAVSLGTIERHVLTFTDTRFLEGETATYLLDGVAIGRGDKGFDHLLKALDDFPPGSILVDPTRYEGTFDHILSPNPIKPHCRPYQEKWDTLLNHIRARHLRFENPTDMRITPKVSEDHLPPLDQ